MDTHPDAGAVKVNQTEVCTPVSKLHHPSCELQELVPSVPGPGDTSPGHATIGPWRRCDWPLWML